MSIHTFRLPIPLLLVLAIPGLAFADGDGCLDGGGGSADIHTLSASFDGTSEITVEMKLCAEADTRTKYRVHFDHTAPFAPDYDRDGNMITDLDDFCYTTSDDGMMHRGNKDTGPGTITVDGLLLTYTVEMSELSSNLAIGDEILVWADTQHKGIQDRAPDTYDGDGCGKPETTGETLVLVLEDCSSCAELQQTADALQATADSAWADADAAQAAADAAQAEADAAAAADAADAQAAADAAQAEADAAQSAAYDAQEEADAAQADADTAQAEADAPCSTTCRVPPDA